MLLKASYFPAGEERSWQRALVGWTIKQTFLLLEHGFSVRIIVEGKSLGVVREWRLTRAIKIQRAFKLKIQLCTTWDPVGDFLFYPSNRQVSVLFYCFYQSEEWTCKAVNYLDLTSHFRCLTTPQLWDYRLRYVHSTLGLALSSDPLYCLFAVRMISLLIWVKI